MTKYSTRKSVRYTLEQPATTPLNTYEIGESIRAMDSKYNTSFQLWIRDSSNAQCIAVRLRRLSEECGVDQLAQAMLWIADGWSERCCRVLFQHVTYRWNEDRKRMLVGELLKPASTKAYQLPPMRNSRFAGRQAPYSLAERKQSVSYSSYERIPISALLSSSRDGDREE
ncbi:hypothetical protein K493DRAFT_306157 [Basidiobolus meristosporus CBS 931.73]|uniref:Uncharacterized protein n=1 Tax=Basidiobolus meristosporus CBS 931.73 TaxID=1314790 RepID=A0A1Y1XTA4_9FUNG|nr:hypothetical protein K493DRAFT_306157 [Basidiobolus meristosporus CBS 931.73]|eukprot:ORX88981.1 hypothetical protein K493DRAFT_306157 [Basidiobolus meristosporus CBS 931.73]